MGLILDEEELLGATAVAGVTVIDTVVSNESRELGDLRVWDGEEAGTAEPSCRDSVLA